MKILQTPVRYYPYTGGVENYCHSLSNELALLGHEVTVLCANEPKSKSEDASVKVKRLYYPGKIANTNITLGLPIELLKESYDLIHTHLPTPWSSDWSALAALIRKKPLILTYHNDITGKGFNGIIADIYNRTFLRFLLGRANRIIIANKNYLEYSPHLKRYSNKVLIIPPGVDTEIFKPTGTKKLRDTLFFLSVLDEFHEYKGLDYLLKAIAVVKKKRPGIRLIVGGEGSKLDYYKQCVASLDIAENVVFAGFIPPEKIVGYYNQAEAFILPSTTSSQEGFGMVLLEAMACATPVIASDVVGLVGEIRDNETGIIVPPKDAEKLAEAIINLLNDEQQKTKRSVNARKLASESFSWKNTAQKIERVYKTLT